MVKSVMALKRKRAQALSRIGSPVQSVRGTLIERYLPCGKEQCQCKRGGPLHGPCYYLTVTYAKGRTRQVYVPKNLKPIVDQWIDNYKLTWQALEEVWAINLELIRQKAIQD